MPETASAGTFQDAETAQPLQSMSPVSPSCGQASSLRTAVGVTVVTNRAPAPP